MAIPKHIVAFSDEKGSVFVSARSIARSILNYLGEKPSEKSRFQKGKTIEEKVLVSITDNKPEVRLRILVHKETDISNLVFLLQEKVKTAMVEDLNMSPAKTIIEIVDYYA